MVSTKLIIIESTLGKFAFTYDKKDNLIYQEFGKTNQIYLIRNSPPHGSQFVPQYRLFWNSGVDCFLQQH